MNGHKKRGATTRSYQTIKVAPTTRAIRAALAVSATMLALAGSGAALAGTCAVTGLSEVTCNGVFTDDVTNTVPVINLVPDLTLVVGTDGTTTVDPAAGVAGITSTWGGDATVITYAEINTSGADGVYMYSDDTATVGNYGSVYTYVTGAGQEGLDVSAVNDVYVTNGGDVTAAAAPLSAYDAIGIVAYSSDGNVNVDNYGSVSGAAYDGAGVGIEAVAYGTVTVNNDGDILGSSFNGYAYGVFAYSTDGDASVTNQGTIEAYSLTSNSYGIDVHAEYAGYVNNSGDVTTGGDGLTVGILVYSYDTTVVNSGSVESVSNNALADGIGAFGTYITVDNSGTVYASGYYWGAGIEAEGTADVSVTNSGTVTGESNGGYSAAFGIYANSHYESATVDNSGSVYAYDNAFGDAIGIDALAYYDATVTNSGSVYAYGWYTAQGISATSYDGYANVTVTDTGYVGAVAFYDATGISANGYYGVTVDNAGSVVADGFVGTATGIFAASTGYDADVSVSNSGSVSAESTYDAATGVSAQSTNTYSDISVDNSGSISAYSYDSSALGVRAYATGYGADISVTNSGSVSSESYYGSAYGILAVTIGDYGDTYVGQSDTGTLDVYSYDGNAAAGIVAVSGKYYGNVTINNAGSVNVSAYNGQAVGFEEIAPGDYGDAFFYNSGSITVSSTYSQAVGGAVVATGYDGDILFDNSGSIEVDGYAAGIGLEVINKYGDQSQIDFSNSGSIDVYSYNAAAVGALIATAGYNSDISVDNSGSLYAGVVNGYSAGFIVQTTGDYADVDFSNSGSVTTYAYLGSSIGVNVVVAGYDSNISVDNSGSVTTTSLLDEATGIHAGNDFDSGYVTVDSSGSVSVYAYGEAFGIEAIGNGYGDTTVSNSGSIYAYSFDDEATGIYAYAYYANVSVDNAGSIEAYSYDEAYGIDAYTYGDGSITITSSGSILATSLVDQVEGINAVAGGDGDVSVDNSGSISVYGYTTADGVYATSASGDVSVVNSGDIYAYGVNFANGIEAVAPYGTTYVANTDTGSISVESGYFGIGINASSKYGTYVLNDGSVLVDASNAYGNAVSVGIYAISEGSNYNKYNTYAAVVNNGSVVAYATSDFLAQAVGIAAIADDSFYNYSYADVVNTGSVVASASGYAGVSIGVEALANYGSIEQYGSAYAYAYGEVFASATGARVFGDYDASFYGAAGSSTSAYATSYYTAIAEGAAVFGNAYVEFYNAGDISATAVSSGAYYFASAIGANVHGDYLSFYNAGNIDASASGYDGVAIGAYLGSDYGFTAYNSGSITATGAGAYVTAIGVEARSGGDIALFNYGDISASADYYAFGVDLITNGSVYIYNAGTIEASDAAYNVAIYTPGYSVDTILNYGTINGAIWSGYGDDYLYNYGEWNPGQTPTYFGSGDDTIVNVGTINMDDSVIDLGTYSVYGNFFYNYGTVAVNGVYNVINMGGPQALVPSLNPNPFYNGGTIDFQDGAPDDMLTIIGDFAGDGDINVDVSGLDGVSDILYIDGSVVSGTAGVINVDLLDLPESIATLVPIVYVTGDSVDGNFVLGDVNWDEDNAFVTLDFDIVSDIDASNATNDVFSLGIEVTGLSDPGTLAASLGSSVQSLMNSQVGTWRQRMGVIDSFNKGGVALWARVFTDKGSFTPEHVAGNFGQGGNFDFDQKNSGVEGGIDFAVTDEFSIGLLVSKSQADIHLDDPGTGNADLDADTWGVYGTWISPNGFYLDASYRWMNFDVDLSSVAGGMETSGDAEAFNVEMGYAWTLEGGLKIEPQLQYTRTSVNNFDVLTTTTGMTFEEDGGDSSRGRLGVSIRKGFGEADNGWLWTPYATLSAVREFNGKSGYAINNTFFGETSVEGTSALLELGFTARHQNWAIYGGLNWQDGGAVNSFFGGQLGVRYTFGHAEPAPIPVAPPPAKTCADLDDDGDGVNNCDDKCLGSAAGEAVGADGCPVPPEPVMEPKPFRG